MAEKSSKDVALAAHDEGYPAGHDSDGSETGVMGARSSAVKGGKSSALNIVENPLKVC